MKKIDLGQKTEKELLVLLQEQKNKLRNLLFDLKLAKLKDTSSVKKLKKDIARTLTALRIHHGRQNQEG